MTFYLTSTCPDNEQLSEYVYKLQLNGFHVESEINEGYLSYWITCQTAEDIERISTVLDQLIIIDKGRIEIYDDYRE